MDIMHLKYQKFMSRDEYLAEAKRLIDEESKQRSIVRNLKKAKIEGKRKNALEIIELYLKDHYGDTSLINEVKEMPNDKIFKFQQYLFHFNNLDEIKTFISNL